MQIRRKGNHGASELGKTEGVKSGGAEPSVGRGEGGRARILKVKKKTELNKKVWTREVETTEVGVGRVPKHW